MYNLISFGKAFNMLVPGQFPGLHVSVSVAEPLHDAPSLAAGVVSDLVRVLVPEPHVAVQADHSPYSPHMQSIMMMMIIIINIIIIMVIIFSIK